MSSTSSLHIFVKVLRASLELTQVRQEIERRLAEKEEEFQVPFRGKTNNFFLLIVSFDVFFSSSLSGFNYPTLLLFRPLKQTTYV